MTSPHTPGPRSVGAVTDELTRLASELAVLPGLDHVHQAVVEAGVRLVPDCDFASITVRGRRNRLTSLAVTSPTAAAADALQDELGQGPCLDATGDEPLVACQDVALQDRWPVWGHGISCRIGAVIAVALVTAGRRYGSLNLYTARGRTFERDAVGTAGRLAVHAGIAIRTAVLQRDFTAAATGRHIVGVAQGLLMSRHGMSQDAALDVLKQASQRSNLKVVDLARQVVDDRGDVVPPTDR